MCEYVPGDIVQAELDVFVMRFKHNQPAYRLAVARAIRVELLDRAKWEAGASAAVVMIAAPVVVAAIFK